MDYQGNSHRQREAKEVPDREPKILTPVVTEGVVVTPPGLGRRIKGVFFGGEFKEVRGYIIADVLLPAVRDLFFDTITEGSKRAIYGATRSARRRDPQVRSRVSYSSMQPSRPYTSTMLPGQPPRNPIRMNYREANDILITNREEANLVLERMFDIISKYDVVSLADLYELLDQPIAAVDHKWGWTYLNNAEIRQVRNGYMLDLPPMEEI